jgi:tetratricopeptide (TPR) repeat protein
VLDATTKIVTEVRSALGDETSESAQLFAMRRMSATSLEAVRHHAAAAEALSNNRFEEARQGYLKAVEIDPTFGLGYQGLAVVSRNLGRLEDADKYIKQALSQLDGMTERERFVTRGFYYRVMGDYQQCVKEYGELVAQFAADVAGHNQRALCSRWCKFFPIACSTARTWHSMRRMPGSFRRRSRRRGQYLSPKPT